ncbi:MAG TPA: hypothetical protein ENJ23_03170, partial [Bacteroidetes bacterium]|nr:hypothetical protein [Bacteroidota bacterium]
QTKAGHRFNIFRWQEDRERILRFYRARDLALARILSERLDSESGVLKVRIDEGKISGIELTGNQKTRNLVVLREFPLRPGQLFRFSLLEKGVENIYSLDLFERVQPEFFWRKNRLHIRIRLREKPFTLLQLRYNYSRDDLFQGQMRWIHNNLLGLGNRLLAEGTLGRRRAAAALSFQSDRVFRSYLSTMVRLYSTSRGIYAFSGGRQVGNFWDERTGLRVSIGQQLKKIGMVNFVFTTESIRFLRDYGYGYPTVRTHKTSLQLQSIVDSRDRVPFPFSGRFQFFYYEVASELMGNETPFFKIYSSLESYFTFFRRWTLHPRLIWAAADMTTPFYEMFPVGGLSSFYGLRNHELLGRRIFVGSLEIRYFLPAKIPVSTYFSLRADWGSVWKNSTSAIQLKDFFSGSGASISFDSLLGVFSLGYGQNSRGRKELYWDFGFKF